MNPPTHQALADATAAETYAMAKISPLASAATGNESAPPKTAHVNSNGVVTYRKRKIGVGMHLAGQPVHITEERGLARIHHGQELVRELLLGPAGTYHPSGRPRGRPRKDPHASKAKIQ